VKIVSREDLQKVRKRLNNKAAELTLAIIEGNDKKANELSKAALESGLSATQLLKACYAGAKGIEDLYYQRKVENAELLLTLGAYIAAMEPYKTQLKDNVKTGSVILGAMESDGEWAATAYTLPLLKEFGHNVHLVASFAPEWYIDEIRKRVPDVVCLTCVRANAKGFVKGIIDALKQAQFYTEQNKNLYDNNTIIGYGTYLTKSQSANIGCHKYGKGFMQIVQVVNEVIAEKVKGK